MIPYPSNALPAYRLLQEYFLFPQKFHFFGLDHLEAGLRGKAMDILILLDRSLDGRLAVDRWTFRLGCTPIINLFSKVSEPIRVDQKKHEYRLEPDIHRPRTTEIHSIERVSASTKPGEESRTVNPFFSYRHQTGGQAQRAYWYGRRVPTSLEGSTGTDLLVSFVDLDFNPRLPDMPVVYAHLLCTNRNLATQLAAGEALQIEDSAPVMGITCLAKPSLPVYPPLGGSTLWYLISNLSLNYLSLSSEPGGLEALREILRLYSFSDLPSVNHQLQGIREMSCERITKRLGKEPWRGFCQGLRINLVFDESLYSGTTAFLLASVLNRFFPLYASVNSFTEVVIHSVQREGAWKHWPPRAGAMELM